MITKLDAYNYELLPGVIRIHINGTNDPDIVDIMSEINRSKGMIYVEGVRYSYMDSYKILPTYMDLDVIELT
jgi:N-acetylglucosamine-6-phosphate deacetylase